MPVSVLQDAAPHPRPILCGNLAGAASVRSALNNSLEQAEWHNLTLASPIGQGHLLDLFRQRGPIDEIVLALPAISVLAMKRKTIGLALRIIYRQGLSMRSRV